MKIQDVRFLKGKRVYLRPVQREDLRENYQRWFNDQEVCRYNSHGVFPVTITQLENYVADENPSRVCLGVFDISGQEHVGNISLQEIDWISRCAEFAIIIGQKNYWNSGVGKESADLMLYHGFIRMNLQRVYCGTSEENIAMQKLAKYLGMQQEGIRRKALYKNGAYKDMFEYGLLKGEYLASENYRTMQALNA